MRCSRLYTPATLATGSTVELQDKASHYLCRVLRLKPGDAVILFNGDGFDYCGTLAGRKGGNLTIELGSRQMADNESALQTTLAQAVSRGERMDYCLQKATELGVTRIQPLLCSRVEVRLTNRRLENRLEHWRGVVIAACEQSGRARVPEVAAPLELHDFLARTGGAQRFLLDPGARGKLSECALGARQAAVLVGPEGGFTAGEVERARHHGVEVVRLGPRVLRTETAGPAALAVLQAVAGDF
ncbi:MAG: 16S rRNA (uracil(1498)-N(3))-methyltransferase [Lysobacterales bacterium]